MNRLIETSRLFIRDFVKEDWESVHTYASREDVVRFMEWGPNSKEETKNFISRAIDFQQQNLRVNYDLAVILKETGELIGGGAINICNRKHKEGFIGYCFNPMYWRKGYGTETAEGLLNFGFNKLNLHRIYATCDINNIGSAKVLENIGMKREGHLRQNKWIRDRWRDSYLYSILEGEYKGNRNNI
ncbi:GNAT family N-acetyltransferase [Maledivibacter halophilus]|uniref:Protein N-acetyltransferase, RimJ/RimL family n=1 Tax=Maledivibacter halophilus TaxID=36842 RepID=A0A1T5LTE1_9FIRM|nr:GNAT family protein [Maledivibacter halophilus]SKC79277.1 Protein N-acetyltransferase, RimJ/RimL family [Maledivibacter halophilus]